MVEDLSLSIGIYALGFDGCSEYYVGRTTTSFYERFRGHLQLLRKGCHSSKHLQELFNQYSDKSLKMFILETGFTKAGMIKRAEKRWTKTLKSYNKVGGGRTRFCVRKATEVWKLEIAGRSLICSGPFYRSQISIMGQLRRNAYPNKEIQEDFNKYGEKETSFELISYVSRSEAFATLYSLKKENKGGYNKEMLDYPILLWDK